MADEKPPQSEPAGNQDPNKRGLDKVQERMDRLDREDGESTWRERREELREK
jgi:hypothetical protein